MALKKSEKRLMVILGIVVAVFLIDQFIISSGDEEASTVKPGAASLNKLLKRSALSKLNSVEGSAVPKISKIEGKRFETWGRDPFMVPKTAGGIYGSTSGQSGGGKQKGGPKLQGFLWKKGKAYVLIDDAVLSEGEEKDGLRVERIRDKEVLCSKGGRTFTLYWRESP